MTRRHWTRRVGWPTRRRRLKNEPSVHRKKRDLLYSQQQQQLTFEGSCVLALQRISRLFLSGWLGKSSTCLHWFGLHPPGRVSFYRGYLLLPFLQLLQHPQLPQLEGLPSPPPPFFYFKLQQSFFSCRSGRLKRTDNDRPIPPPFCIRTHGAIHFSSFLTFFSFLTPQ
jgi:hypothetical protein